MFNWIFYRCMLNASLNVKIFQLPIKSWEDLANSDYGVSLWRGSYLDAMLSQSPDGSVKKRIFDEKVQHTVPLNDMTVEESIDKVLDGSIVILTGIAPYKESSHYPCEIIELKAVK